MRHEGGRTRRWGAADGAGVAQSVEADGAVQVRGEIADRRAIERGQPEVGIRHAPDVLRVVVPHECQRLSPISVTSRQPGEREHGAFRLRHRFEGAVLR